ncbi:MAG: helix-turn-helix transcriptional regulator, partial [Candidatus Erginobacter occultus]|nr:helix-turn-helix transcriptional regulator [Candidatus Erginobacter occultus]
MTNNIGVNLRRFRKLKNYSQQQLAEKAGISRVAYRNIETGDSEPRPSNLNALASALGVSVFDLTEQV